jgi:hypothetical protein
VGENELLVCALSATAARDACEGRGYGLGVEGGGVGSEWAKGRDHERGSRAEATLATLGFSTQGLMQHHPNVSLVTEAVFGGLFLGRLDIVGRETDHNRTEY